MKKSIIALIFLLFLTSCNYNSIPQELVKKAELVSISQEKHIDISQTEHLELPKDANILFFDENVILFYIEEWNDDNSGMDLTVYRYSTCDQVYETLATIENIQYITGRISLHNNEIYIPILLDNNKNKILSLDIRNKDCNVISEWEGNTFICDTYIVDNQLIIFQIIATNETRTDYEVNLLNLKDFTNETIFHSYYENGTGTVISAITTDNKDLLLYSIDYKNNRPDIQILQYNLENKSVTELGIVSKKTIQEKSLTVTGFIRNNNYFIFETLEGNILIEASNNTTLLPSFDLEDVTKGRYRILDTEQYNPPLTNFATVNNQEVTIYQFSSENHTLTPVHFDFSKKNLNHYYTNTYGDIIFKSNNVDTSNTEFYMIKEAAY